MSHDNDKYIQNINKTGFPLEYKISEDLLQKKWNVINNRYYIDDSTNNMREIDILAYKVSIVDEVRYYTTLLISSKKSEDRDWAFLTKKLNQNDPNLDYFPTSNWSNDDQLEYMLKESKWREELIGAGSKDNKLMPIYTISEDLFAFQEMNKKTGRIQNDKAIYSSISSLVKALSYEVINLDSRITHNSFYSFYLVSVVDTDFKKLHFSGKDISCTDINEINYLNRFIVNGKDDFFKIHFITYNSFAKSLISYNYLHQWNVKFFSKKREQFRENLVQDWSRLHHRKKKYGSDFQDELHYITLNKYLYPVQLEKPVIVYEPSKDKLRIYVSQDEKFVDFLNTSKEINKSTKEMLNRFFFYQGDYFFSTDDIPF